METSGYPGKAAKVSAQQVNPTPAVLPIQTCLKMGESELPFYILSKLQEGSPHEKRRHKRDGLTDHGGAVVNGVGSLKPHAHGAVGLGPRPRMMSSQD